MAGGPRPFWSVLLVASLVGGSSVFLLQPAEAGHSSSHNSQYYCGFSVSLPSSTVASDTTAVVRVSYCQAYTGWTTIQVFRDGERVEKAEWHTSSNTWRTVDISFPAGSAGAKEIWVYGLADRVSSDPRAGFQNFNGHAGALAVESTTTDTPGPPQSLTATVRSSTNIFLDWETPTSNGGATITGYRLYRATSQGAYPSTPTATMDQSWTSFDNTAGLSPSTTYYYKVTAVNSAGEGSGSEVSARTSDPPATVNPPSQPPGLTAEVRSSTNIFLDWDTPSSNGGATITGYRLYRATSPGGFSSTPTATMDQSWTSFDNTAGLSPSTTYYYKVTAVNSAGESQGSEVSARTNDPPDTAEPSPPPPTVSWTTKPPTSITSGATFTVGWSATGNFDTVNIHWDPSYVGDGCCTANSLTSGSTTWLSDNSHMLTAPTVDSPTTIKYVVHLHGSTAAYSTTESVTVNPTTTEPPTGAITLTNESPDCTTGYPGVRLNWNAASGANVVYDLYRDGSLNSARTGITGTEFYNAYSGGGLDAGSTYEYKVTARNSGGSIDSNMLSVWISSDVCTTTTSPSPTPQPQYTDPQEPPTEPSQPPPGSPETDPTPDLPPETQRSGTGYFFIHGICGTGDMWTNPEENGHAVWAPLTRGGVPYATPTYGPDTGQVIPRDQVAFLKKQLEQFLDSENLEHVVLVGHSNGGLMARALLAAEVGTRYEQLIERVVTIDSPDLGGDKTFVEYQTLWLDICKDYEGRIYKASGWPAYAMTFLDRDGGSGVGWMTGDFPGLAALSTDSSKVIRFVFGECWGHWTERPLGLIRPTLSAGCKNGGILAVRPHDADMDGAVLLAFARNTDGNPGLDAARAACEQGGTFSTPTSEIRAVGIRKSTPPLVGNYHSWGIDYFSSFIESAARDGMLGFYGAHGTSTSTFQCSLVKEGWGDSVVAVVTVSAPVAAGPASTGPAQGPLSAQLYNSAKFEIRVLPPTPNTLSLGRVTIESEDRPGKIVVFNVAAAAMQGPGKNGIRVLLDGVAVPSVASAADLHGDNAVYYRPARSGLTDEGTQFLVWIPHFSERTIEIMGIDEDFGQAFVTPLGVAFMTAGALLVAGVAYGVGRRRGRGPSGGIDWPGDGTSASGDESDGSSSLAAIDAGTFGFERRQGLDQSGQVAADSAEDVVEVDSSGAWRPAFPAATPMPRGLLAWSIGLGIPVLAVGILGLVVLGMISRTEEDLVGWTIQNVGTGRLLVAGLIAAVPLTLLSAHLVARKRWSAKAASTEHAATSADAQDELLGEPMSDGMSAESVEVFEGETEVSNASLAPTGDHLAGKQRTFGRGIGLITITLGFYILYWHHKARKELHRQFGGEHFPAGLYVWCFVPLVNIICMPLYMAGFLDKVNKLRFERQLPPIFSLGGFLGWYMFVPIAGPFVAYSRLQHAINEIWNLEGQATGTPTQTAGAVPV